jgi:plastocyanin
MLRFRWKNVWPAGAFLLAMVPLASAYSGSDGPAGKTEQQITIDNFTFTPSKLTVAAGTTVTWVNRDDVPHTATSSQKPRAFDSGTLDTDQKFSHVFAQPGTYDYFCAVHPHMTGQIIVK